jgi:glycine/D-amino acid oxidase-like deaminating enzyme
LSVALLDKHEIGSQTSPRAAAMVSCLRKGDLMISLIKDACRKIEAFTEETGQPLDWVHSGSLKIAHRSQDSEVIDADFERGRRMGLDVELISPEQASPPQPVPATGRGRGRDEESATTDISIHRKSPSALLGRQRRGGGCGIAEGRRPGREHRCHEGSLA